VSARKAAEECALHHGLREQCFTRGELVEEAARLDEHHLSGRRCCIVCCCWGWSGAVAAQFAGEQDEEAARLDEHHLSGRRCYIVCCCWGWSGAVAAQFAGEQDEEAILYKTRQSAVVLFDWQTAREQPSYFVTTSEAHLCLQVQIKREGRKWSIPCVV
jgi:hypothetical protein